MNDDFDELKLKIEAILFTADQPLEIGEIRAFLGDISLTDIRLAIKSLEQEYAYRAFELYIFNNKYQIKTRDRYVDLIRKQVAGSKRSLSKNALETLAVIAYKQPITKAQINALRQLDSSAILQTLKEKELIYICGIKQEVGRPVEYATTKKFLEIFGLKDLSALPQLRSLQLNLDEQQHIAQVLQSFAD